MPKPTPQEQAIFGRLLDFKPRKADIRRMEILNAVIDCIASEGVYNLNSIAIAKQAKMLRSHVAYYFPTQEKMVEAAVKYVVALGQEIAVGTLAGVSDPRARVGSYVDAVFIWLSQFPKHGAVMALLYYQAGVSPTYREIMAQLRDVSEDRIAGLLKAGEKGKPSGSAKETAGLIRNFLMGSLLTFYGTEDRSKFESLRKSTRKQVLALAHLYWNDK